MGQRKFNESLWVTEAQLLMHVLRDDVIGVMKVNQEHNIWRIEFEANTSLNFKGSLIRYASYITARGR